MPVDLRDRTIIITGASSGIGAATARACARAGMDVVLTARRADRLEALASEIRSAGRRAEVVAGDAVDPEIPAALLAAAPGFHAVFANAGYGSSRSIVDASPEEERRMFDVNYFAAVELLRAAARNLLESSRGGHLLMCSSCVSKFSLPRYASYAATKAAQDAWCMGARLELRGAGIAVSSVHPITTTTEFVAVAHRTGGRSDPGPPKHAPKAFVQPPERVADAVVACLRRPRPEVWTSTIVRAVAAFKTFFPRLGDAMIHRQARKDDGA